MDEKWLMQQAGWNLEKLVDVVCQFVSVKAADWLLKGRINNLTIVKALISYWGRKMIGLTVADITIFLAVSQPAISKASKRGADYCEENNVNWKRVLK